MASKIIQGDCLEVMRTMENNSISCIVTDPPYGLGFMGKSWDAGLPHADIWKEALRIIKPGGHLLAFGGTRTYHRLTCAIEDAGFEIRDCLMWLYGSGLPKSHNHFGIEGYGTALKPAYEPIIMAMKKCDGTFAQNAEKWGQAGINIDECRLETIVQPYGHSTCGFHDSLGRNRKDTSRHVNDNLKKGRWPANVILDEEAGEILNEQSGIEASRFFYCAKASSSERNEGCENLPDIVGKRTQDGGDDTRGCPIPVNKNHHPTVKPLKLMEYLIKLVMPPKDGLLLDPFAGSGSTIVAAERCGFNAIGIELNEEYCKIANARLENERNKPKQTELF